MSGDTVLFDINETVLNLHVLKPLFSSVFDNEFAVQTWFAMLLHTSTVSVITEVKTDFRQLSDITIRALAARQKRHLSDDTVSEILASFASLPAHDDIKPALTTLKQAGFSSVAFSNSSQSLITSQIRNAGLDGLFDDVISVQGAGTFKPSVHAYEYAANTLGKALTELRLVATHDWDTHGAICAGMQAAYIDRLGAQYNPLYNKPDIVASTMTDLVEQIIAREQ